MAKGEGDASMAVGVVLPCRDEEVEKDGEGVVLSEAVCRPVPEGPAPVVEEDWLQLPVKEGEGVIETLLEEIVVKETDPVGEREGVPP